MAARSWLVIDIIAIFPSGYIARVLNTSVSDGEGEVTQVRALSLCICR